MRKFYNFCSHDDLGVVKSFLVVAGLGWLLSSLGAGLEKFVGLQAFSRSVSNVTGRINYFLNKKYLVVSRLMSLSL